MFVASALRPVLALFNSCRDDTLRAIEAVLGCDPDVQIGHLSLSKKRFALLLVLHLSKDFTSSLWFCIVCFSNYSFKVLDPIVECQKWKLSSFRTVSCCMYLSIWYSEVCASVPGLAVGGYVLRTIVPFGIPLMRCQPAVST